MSSQWSRTEQSKFPYLLIMSFTSCFAQTLTTLNIDSNRIGPTGADHLASGLQHNQVTLTSSFHSLTILHRHLPHFTPEAIRLVHREQNTLPMLYDKIKYCLPPPRSYHSSTYLLIHPDARHTEPRCQCNRSTRSRTSGQCSTTKQSNIRLLFLSISPLSISHTDNHHTFPRLESNRSTRGRIFCQCSTTKSSDTSLVLCFILLVANYFTQTLTTLKLHDNRIGDDGWQRVLEIRKNNPGLNLTLN
jgi:hypothetical protein